MKYIWFSFMFIVISASSQQLVLDKAEMQTINQGAAPVSVTNYTITVLKQGKFCWSIDSVYGIQSNQAVKYNITKVNDPSVISPDYKKVTVFKKKDQGKYQITFAIFRSRESGRRGSPPHIMADTTNIEGGVIIYYTVRKKTKKLRVDVFEKLETIDAP